MERVSQRLGFSRKSDSADAGGKRTKLGAEMSDEQDPPPSQAVSGSSALEALPASLKDLRLRDDARGADGKELTYEGRVVEGDPASGSHVIRTAPVASLGGLGGGSGGGGGGGAAAASNGAAAATATTASSSGAAAPASPGPPAAPAGPTFSFSTTRVVGNGSFGVVFQATCLETGETVAIKKVLQDRRFKNRELAVMKMVRHPNIVCLRHCFYTPAPRDEVYLNLVLEFVPETVYRVSKHYAKGGQRMPALLVKLYVYQACRALAHLHNAAGVCHRDVKPQNLLVDPTSHVLKLCDFGSAKVLVPGEPNISYICSRYYRAPELIFGASDYTPAIDVWSVGCVAAELLLGSPLFPGESGVDQLVEIIKVLGTPSRAEIAAMNPNYTDFKFPQIRAHPWSKVFSRRMPPEAVDLVARLLRYAPGERATPLEAMAHPFFDELRDPATTLPSGAPLPPGLQDWLPGELSSADPEVARVLTYRGPASPERAAAVVAASQAQAQAAAAAAAAAAATTAGTAPQAGAASMSPTATAAAAAAAALGGRGGGGGGAAAGGGSGTGAAQQQQQQQQSLAAAP